MRLGNSVEIGVNNGGESIFTPLYFTYTYIVVVKSSYGTLLMCDSVPFTWYLKRPESYRVDDLTRDDLQSLTMGSGLLHISGIKQFGW